MPRGIPTSAKTRQAIENEKLFVDFGSAKLKKFFIISDEMPGPV
jgi:hypothetical protein